jgi:hypothetical protein
MNLRNIFKTYAVLGLLNAIGGLFFTAQYLGSAGWVPTPELMTLGQFMGMTFLIIAIWSWRIPDIAGDILKSMGMLFAIGGLLWTVIIAFHIMTGAASGATAYVNIILTGLFAVGFYFYSKD